MKKAWLLATLALAMVLTGCSPFALVYSETYNDANLADYKTFRIVTPDEGSLPPGMEMVTYYNIAAAIRAQLMERGFTEDPKSPLLVNIALTVKNEIATKPALPPEGYAGPYFMYNPYMPYPPYAPYFMMPRYGYWDTYYSNAQVITGVYKEGVLTMDLVNMKEKLPLYSAAVAALIDGGNGKYRNLAGIAEAVQTLFSQFPVPLLPQYRNKK